MLIYNYNVNSGELLSYEEADQSPLEEGIFLLPSNATFIKPEGSLGEFQAFCFNSALNVWFIVPDYRGVILYSKNDKSRVYAALGESLDEINATAVQPTNEYDVWDNVAGSWIYSKDLEVLSKKSEVDKNIESLLEECNMKISILSDAYELGIITQLEKIKLIEWKTYRILLSRVSEQETYPLIVEYPIKPE